LRAHPFAITPFVAFGIPSNDYIYFAHSAAGTNQREYVFGSSFGRSLEPVLSRAYVQALYAFLIPEKIRGIRTYRSRLDWEVGYFAAQRFALRALGALQIGHSGLAIGDPPKDLGDFRCVRQQIRSGVTMIKPFEAVISTWAAALALPLRVLECVRGYDNYRLGTQRPRAQLG